MSCCSLITYVNNQLPDFFFEKESDLGLHCLLQPICPNTGIENFYGLLKLFVNSA